MIEVAHVTKRYPGRTAVDDVSFEVARGEVAGFLGPNGAGKSTTLRMLAGYLPASGGTVRVAGYDVATHPIEVRRRIGYLPENCPLPPELRVDEYLDYRARVKGVPGHLARKRVAEVKARCGIADIGRRVIGQLSKGYRQRVGFADALVHDPDLLILDEPTIGLDPNQIRLVRDLIRELGERHTILLSTHILPEVEMTCRRVLILHQGRIAADGETALLRHGRANGALVLAELRAAREELAQALAMLSGAASAQVQMAPDGWCRAVVRAADGRDLREPLYALAVSHGWPLRELRAERASLEDVFAELTGADEPGGAA